MTTGSDERLIEGLEHLPEGSFDDLVPPEDLRTALLARTTRTVRARRHRARFFRAAAALLIFAAGVTVGTLRSTDASTRPPPPEARGHVEVDETLPADPHDLEIRLADATPDERARVLRSAGDRYIEAGHADPAAALYCYRRLLDEAPEGSAAPGIDDGWLLTYLKLQDY